MKSLVNLSQKLMESNVKKLQSDRPSGRVMRTVRRPQSPTDAQLKKVEFKMTVEYDKNYEAIRLQLDDSGLICNPNLDILPNSEIIAVKDIASMQFVDYYIINYYKAATDKVWRNKFFNEAFEEMNQDSEHLYVRFRANDVIVQTHSPYRLCTDKCVASNIIEVVSDYKTMLNVMSSVEVSYERPTYELYNNDYCCDEGTYTLQDGSGYFALAYELNSCNFYCSYEDFPNKFSENFPECVYWRIYWCNDKEYEDTLSDFYKDEDFVLYLTNTSAWYDKHNK